jgi:replicative DNA helicase
LSDTNERPAPQLLRLGDLLGEWERDASAAHLAHTQNQPRGPITGLGKVDQELGGALGPGLHILHGAPGAGKTGLLLQAAADCGCPCVFVTAEMSPIELLRRLTARATGTYLGRLKSGELRPEDSLNLAKRGAAMAPELRIADATREPVSPDWLRQAAAPIRDTGAHLLLVIDSLNSWSEGFGAGASEYDTLNEALASLRALAHRLSCPIVLSCERNRQSMKTGGQSAGAGSRRIEYGAESVLDLHRDEDTKPDINGEVPVEVRFAKNRNGCAGKAVKLHFHGALQKFREAQW